MNPIVKYFSQERSGSMLFVTVGVIASAIALHFFLGLKPLLVKESATALVAMLELAEVPVSFFAAPKT